MKLTSKQRWGLYAGALALTLGLIFFGPKPENSSPSQNAAAPKQAPTPNAQAPANNTAQSAANAPATGEGLPERAHNAPQGDPFGARSWEGMQAAEQASNEPPPPPPEPEPPPLPYRYLGRWIEGDQTVVFLNANQRNLAVRVGDTIDGSYKVTRIDQDRMTLLYLPLHKKQELNFKAAGGAYGGGRPAQPDEGETSDEDGGEGDEDNANEPPES